MLTRDEYVAKMKQRLDKWSTEMDGLEAKALKTQEDAKAKYQEQLIALRAKRQEGEEKLKAIQSATEDSCSLANNNPHITNELSLNLVV